MHRLMEEISLLRNSKQSVRRVARNFCQNVDIIIHNQQYPYVDYVKHEDPNQINRTMKYQRSKKKCFSRTRQFGSISRI